MEYSNDIIICSKSKSLLELDCTITANGHSFTANGSFLVPDKKGKLRGILYAYPNENKIGSWNGEIKIDAEYLHEWKNGFYDVTGRPQINQKIRFKYQGRQFAGIWHNKNWSSIVRVREVKQ
ncbi:hypothetical protein Ngar_c27890 [Candidatus Nitrososphaera gargensis Ga9.2]|uniref:Uncharacterized protein n=1 Tax=Nitrososphaera gargensis (strain Ga9.2) TaxID=1237085 RepID=K0III6_NITGG|nr:hypothetical protein [Candidatus Nitrososphaera gargensis]AFU59710.1 hypothetical protein Ngar_c27890 [Candidatus Nitrososphaera gargensis Ga9.2]